LSLINDSKLLLFSVIDTKFTLIYASMHRIPNIVKNTRKEMDGNRKLNSSWRMYRGRIA
jgi:hypothetical protein